MQQAIRRGFDDPVHQSQQVFRAVLEGMARPGRVQRLAHTPIAAPGLSPAATAVCLSLLDFETPVWLDQVAVAARDHLVFHCGTPIAMDPRQAAFAIIGDTAAIGDFERFNMGTDERPDISTTVIIEVDGLAEGRGVALAGPGIETRHLFDIRGVDGEFQERIAANHLLFPRGVDLILTSGDRLAALPRSVRLHGEH
jgi:alpha-D-ribose 1-methylphosphonate 5-triphosphate synthase subunit PhnH